MENIQKVIMELFLTNGVIIAVGCFVVGQIIKTLKFIDNKYIPLICGILGIVLGITIPALFPNKHIIVCAINGLVLGWGATGGVETVKQLKGGQ